ncbi:MAG: DUF309 domain-containing protein [Ignavibacteriales bacterium]|nr:DUF309 domain-containing protein [Ignavibacteriales bacterium]MBI3787150.1 DUF309 domain-containing protein [Ignavibacteriales bacterium]
MKLPHKKKAEEIDRSLLAELHLSSDEWEKYLAGIELFNAHRFWEAHEAWEEVWKHRGEESRIFFQGIIQAAAAYHLVLVKRRHGGARNNFAKSLTKLELFPNQFLGMDVAALREMLAEAKKKVESLGPERMEKFPAELIPVLKIERGGT